MAKVSSSELYQRNPKLVVNELNTEAFVVYIPNEPKPLRLPSTAWTAIERLGSVLISHTQLLEQLKSSHPDYEAVDQYLDWLLNKKVFIRVELAEGRNADQQTYGEEIYIPNITREAKDGDDDSKEIHLITLKPSWPTPIKAGIYYLLYLQIWMAAPMLLIVVVYLCFFILTPAPSSLNLLELTAPATGLDVIERMVAGLLTVNLFSTGLTWLAQSICSLGDGKIVLRFIFGFIPRFGITPFQLLNPDTAGSKPSSDLNRKLICAAQPLFSRLILATGLILLLVSGRLQNTYASLELHAIASTVLQISIITGLILALPYRRTPGYRLLVLLKTIPSNSISKSYKRLFFVLRALWAWMNSRDRSSWEALKGSMSKWQDIQMLFFALFSGTIIIAQLLVVLFIGIPRLATNAPSLFGMSSEFVFILILCALVIRFIFTAITAKISSNKEQERSTSPPLASENVGSRFTESPNALIVPTKRFYLNKKTLLGISALILVLLFPINRTVAGSVVVSTQQDLTVRAPADVRITKIYQRGPSTQVIASKTPLIELQSQELTQEIYQSNSSLIELRQELDMVTEKLKSDNDILKEMRASIAISDKALKIIEKQLLVIRQLAQQGAYSEKMVQDILLQSYDLEEVERDKIQEILSIQAEIIESGSKAKSIQQSIQQSLALKNSLLAEQMQLTVVMPFDGLITSSTSGLMGSFVSKGESLLELKQGSLDVVDVLIPDHDRSLVKVGQTAEVRLYAEQTEPRYAVVHTIRPSGEIIDDKVFFKASLRLSKNLSPQLLQSSGAARIKTGRSNLLLVTLNSVSRFVLVDLWSWTP